MLKGAGENNFEVTLEVNGALNGADIADIEVTILGELQLGTKGTKVQRYKGHPRSGIVQHFEISID